MLEILQKQARELLQIEFTTSQLDLFERYYQELIDWNSRINLTSIVDYEAVQVRHFLDSLTLASPLLRGDDQLDLNQAALIDIGAGAGFPGIPLKIIYPALALTLVESVGKKTAFLNHLVKALNLSDVKILTGRAEEFGQDSAHRAHYDLATGRAVAAWSVLAEYCLPLCKIGGIFVAPKKGDLTAELGSSEAVASLLGAKLRPTPTFQLIGDEPDVNRRLIVAQKISRTAATYPRRIGLPAKQPLG